MHSFTSLTTLALAAVTSLSSAYYFEPRDHENYHPSQHQHSRRAIAARFADAYAYAHAEALPEPYIVLDDDHSYNHLSARDASLQWDNYDYDLLYRRIVPPSSPPKIDTGAGGSFFGGPMVGSPSGSPGGSPGGGSQGSFFGGPMVGSPTGSPPGSPGAPPPSSQGQKRPAEDAAQSANPKKQNTGAGSPPGSGGSFFGGPMSGSPGSSPVSSPGVSPVGSPTGGSPGSPPSPMTPPAAGPPQRQQSVYNAQLPAGAKENPVTGKKEPVTTPNIRNQGEVNTQALANARAGGRRLRRRWTI